jgi:hypothetical protein
MCFSVSKRVEVGERCPRNEFDHRLAHLLGRPLFLERLDRLLELIERCSLQQLYRGYLFVGAWPHS